MNNLVLFYDTETTGLPDWKAPSDAEHQPHLVQIAAILADADTREEISSIDLIIRPDGWTIPDDVSEIHGITNKKAQLMGVPESLALEIFMKMWGSVDRSRVAHNKTFDQRLIRIALKRYGFPQMDAWADKDSHHCTMRMYQKRFSCQRPKLIDAYKDATGNELTDAHSALADTRACMDVYWWLLDQQKPESSNPFDVRETSNVSE